MKPREQAMDWDAAGSSSSDALPRYEMFTSGDLIAELPAMNEDGRLDIEVNPRLVRSLSLLPNFKLPSARESDEPPPPYSPPKFRTTASQLFPIKLNIVVQIVGSRGDIQPFVALGVELQKHGHRVRIATHNVFDSFVRDSGLEFFPIQGDPVELMAYMVRNPSLIPAMKSLRAGDVQKKRRMIAEILDGCWSSCIDPDPISGNPFVADAIIANPPSFAHIHCAQALGIPVHMMFTMPWTSTKSFPHPLVNLKFSQDSSPKPMVANYISYAVVEFMTWQGLGDIINQWRETIGLEHIAFSEGPRLAETLNIPHTYCWSPALIPKPADWGSHIDVCGFIFREPPQYSPPPELDAFLKAGPPPVYVGFGSIVLDNPKQISEILIEAFRITKTRAIISRGWSKLDGPESSDIMFLGDCPHEWLFQHVSVVIHHGGAGTTACGLLNGRPTIIVPFFGDQPFWGDRVAAAGAGPSPISQKHLTVQKFVEAIQFCQTPKVSEAAQKLAKMMRSESGVKAAVSSFHSQLSRFDLECDIIKGQPAAWTYTRKGVRLKLSRMAADILSSHLKIDYSNIKPYESRRIVIETHRWDPFTGTVAAAVGVGVDLAKAAKDTVALPIRVYQRSERGPRDDQVEAPNTDVGSTPYRPKPRVNSRGCQDVTQSMAMGMGNLVKKLGTGAVVIPLAFTEGFRNVPMLYGEEVRDYGEIYDWKSGTIVGAKAMVYGIADGIGGLFILPYKGAQQEGAMGAIKGIGKGMIGVTSHLFTATMGMATYPLHGIYKSVISATNSRIYRSIREARVKEGRFVAGKGDIEGVDHKFVMDTFDALVHNQIHA